MSTLYSECLALVIKLGWRYKHIRDGIYVYPPNGSRPIPIHQSKKDDARRKKNLIAQLRRAGADI